MNSLIKSALHEMSNLEPSNSNGSDLLEAMRSFQQGVQASFDSVHKAICGPVYRRAFKMGLKDTDAEEITQKVMVRIYLYAPKATFAGIRQLWGWIYTITAREVYKYWAKRRPETICDQVMELWLDQSSDPQDDPASTTEAKEMIDDVNDCIRRLNEADRLHLLGPLTQGVTFRQAAAIHRLTLGKFKHLYQKALHLVRECMKSKGHILD